MLEKQESVGQQNPNTGPPIPHPLVIQPNMNLGAAVRDSAFGMQVLSQLT